MGAEVTANIQIAQQGKDRSSAPGAGAILWLVPLDTPAPPGLITPHPVPLQLAQKNKSFQPHMLVVRAGESVAFPNADPFFHNVFSLFNGKRFDLGLYESGATRYVKFDRPGICYIFCNIHPEMSAVIIVLDTPYYGISNTHGKIAIEGVPPGDYRVGVWQERADPASLDALHRDMAVVAGTNSLGTLEVRQAPLVGHNNLYGRPYEPPSPPTPGYSQR
jgi:plastocyanin